MCLLRNTVGEASILLHKDHILNLQGEWDKIFQLHLIYVSKNMPQTVKDDMSLQDTKSVVGLLLGLFFRK